ncbi:E1-E2 ATPase [Musa troglodytarum]|uniref:E1-E2 ATPase n=1 Tax=Musa troglodytarum TaxID=320322 RepID=A0A9E7EEM6_9LILI|nr:E1-E2 ATPase [Musa troglodytarum]
MPNSSGAPSKRGRLEAHMYREVILQAVALVALCFIVTVLAGLWLTNHHDELNDLPSYKEDFSGPETDTYSYYGDKNRFDEGSKTRFQCRALNINEDLWQMKYVFSDKTGTLMENKTEFRCASVGGLDYSAASKGEEDGYSITGDSDAMLPSSSSPICIKIVSDDRSSQWTVRPGDQR